MKKINYIIISVLFSLLFIVLYFSLGNEKIYNTQDLVGKKISEGASKTFFTLHRAWAITDILL